MDAHIAGLWLRRLTGTPWVADFRDPYLENPKIRSACPTPIHRLLLASLERQFVRQAAHVVTTTDTLAEVLARRYRRKLGRDVSVIPNGYDTDIFGDVEKPRRKIEGPFRLAFFGSAYDAESFELFLRGVGLFVKEARVDPKQFGVLFVGQASSMIRSLTDRLGLGEFVEHRPLVAHRQAVETMRSSPALLVVRDRTFEKLCIPAKVYQYMLANRPILCVANAGPLRELCETHRLGPCADLDDVDGIRVAIREMFELHQAGKLERHWHHRDVEQFSRNALAERLSEVLTAAMKGT